MTIDELHRPPVNATARRDHPCDSGNTCCPLARSTSTQVGRRHFKTENICTSDGKGYVVKIETSFRYTCYETCEMNVSAVCAASQNTKLSACDQRKPSDPMPCLLPSNGWCGVVTTNQKSRTSSSSERAVVRDILTEKKHRSRETHWKFLRDRMCQRVVSKTFLVDQFSNVTNFGCENSGMCKTLATIQEFASDETRTWVASRHMPKSSPCKPSTLGNVCRDAKQCQRRVSALCPQPACSRNRVGSSTSRVGLRLDKCSQSEDPSLPHKNAVTLCSATSFPKPA